MTEAPPPPHAGLLAGKRGLIMGLANDRSIAWGVTQMAHQAGAELAFTYQGDMLLKRVRPLIESLGGASPMLACDVGDAAAMQAAADRLRQDWGSLDFLVHSIGFSDKDELEGRYLNTSRDNFLRTMEISVYSFTHAARVFHPLLNPGASLLTLTYYGSEKVIPNYNVMGVAKAALEASVRYLAADLGPEQIRVNAISAGAIRTLAASGISSFRTMLRYGELAAPLRRSVTQDEVGQAALMLLGPLGSGITGEVLHVDCGVHAMGMPSVEVAGEVAELMRKEAESQARRHAPAAPATASATPTTDPA